MESRIRRMESLLLPSGFEESAIATTIADEDNVADRLSTLIVADDSGTLNFWGNFLTSVLS
jgi:hypothetical protein